MHISLHLFKDRPNSTHFKRRGSRIIYALLLSIGILTGVIVYRFALLPVAAQSGQSVMLVLSAPDLDERAGFTSTVRDDGMVNELQQQFTWPQQEGSYFEYGYLDTERAYDLLSEKTPPQKLALLLGAAAGRSVELALAYGGAPTQVTQNGAPLTPVNSLLGLAASMVSTYYHDAPLGKLYLKLNGAAQEQLFLIQASGSTGGGSLGPIGHAPDPVTSVAPGLYYEYYEISGSLESQTPVQVGVVADFDLSDRQRDVSYAFRYIGYINVPEEAIYTFSLSADSDSRVLLGGAPLLSHSGDATTPIETVQAIALQAGLHHIVVDYTHTDNADHMLLLSWESPTIAKQPIPAVSLFFPTEGTTILPEPHAELTPTATTTMTPTQTLSATSTPVASQTPVATASPTGSPNGSSARTQHLPLVIGGARTNNQVPTVSLTGPEPDDLFRTTDVITLTARAADDQQIINVQFYADGALLGEDLVAPYQFVWAEAEVGLHQLQAKAVDNHGYSAISTPVGIVVEEALSLEPSVFLIEPAHGATVTETVSIKMGAANFTIEPAGGVQPGAGHFHLMIDAPCVAIGETIPMDANHRHFGLGQTETTLMLTPGSHALCLQAGDGIHTALGLTDQITITVQ